MSQSSILTRAISFALPELKIHCWGGLGSQLLALTFFRHCVFGLKYRRIRIVFHDSGVTKRDIEIPERSLSEIHYSVRRNFGSVKNQQSETTKFEYRSKIKPLLKEFLNRARFVYFDDSALSERSIKFWTFSIRCTYDAVRVLKDDIFYIIDILKLKTDTQDIDRDSVAVHYRLGDLVSLNTKTYMNPESIDSLLRNQSLDRLALEIFSDSKPNDVLATLSDELDVTRAKVLNLGTISTIDKCLRYRVFVGTNSKVSMWIVMFRCVLLNDSISYLPASLANSVHAHLRGLEFSHRIFSYDAAGRAELHTFHRPSD